MARTSLRLPRLLSVVFFLWCCLPGAGLSQPRNILGRLYPPDVVRKVLLPQAKWSPVPKGSERKQWEDLPAAWKAECVKKGEQALEYQWPVITATLFLDYVRTGSRENFSRLYSERRQKVMDLVLAECAEGKGRFLDKIADGIWLICDEASWVQPAHLADLQGPGGLPDVSNPVVDLTAAETGNLVAWTCYLLSDQLVKVSPQLPARMKLEVTERILKPNLTRDDFWWMWARGREQSTHHINNWTPWICSNWLIAELLVENNDDHRHQSVSKIIAILDRFLNSYPDDGGCDEGPSYWGQAGGSLFECLELLGSASDGQIDVYAAPLIREIGRYIYRAHIHDSYFVNFSDAPARVSIPAELVMRYGMRIHDDTLAGLGAFAAGRQRGGMTSGRGSLTRQFASLFTRESGKEVVPKEPLLRDVWLPQTQFMAAREHENSIEGLYLAAQGLHNEKSHNHNDVGNFVLYADGEPVLIDVGVEAYTAKTFSADRYSIWTMQSAYHNLPTINGQMQKNGRQYAAKDVHYTARPEYVAFSLDLSAAYPREANVRSWKRTLSFERTKGMVTLAEQYDINDKINNLTLNLMTPCQVVDTAPDRLVLRLIKPGSKTGSVDILLKFDPAKLEAQVETVPVKDDRLRRVWGDNLQRILLKAKSSKNMDGYSVTFSKMAG